jgi:hypothetical protein
MWISWLARNAVCFNTNQWPPIKLECMIWDALQDHAHAVWKHCYTCSQLYPALTGKFITRFDDTWSASSLVCTCNGMSVSWSQHRPMIWQFS